MPQDEIIDEIPNDLRIKGIISKLPKFADDLIEKFIRTNAIQRRQPANPRIPNKIGLGLIIHPAKRSESHIQPVPDPGPGNRGSRLPDGRLAARQNRLHQPLCGQGQVRAADLPPGQQGAAGPAAEQGEDDLDRPPSAAQPQEPIPQQGRTALLEPSRRQPHPHLNL
jgi:hypothetical protein